MGCWCDKKKGGNGKMNTHYTYHLYLCELYLDDIDDYSYEQFGIDYKKLETEKKTSLEIRTYFQKMLDNFLERDN